MFVIEDLHWADRSTLDLVALLVRALRADARARGRHASAPTSCTAATRCDRSSRAGSACGPCSRIELERFGRDDVERQLAGDPRRAARRTAGRPGPRALGGQRVPRRGDPRRGPERRRPRRAAAVPARRPAGPRGAPRPVHPAAAADRGGRGPVGVGPAARRGRGPRRRRARRCAARGPRAPRAGGRRDRRRLRLPPRPDPRRRLRRHAARASGPASTPRTARRCPPTRRSPAGTSACRALLALHWTAAHDLPRALEASVEAARLAAPYAPAEALRHLERALEIWPQVPDARGAQRHRRRRGAAPRRRERLRRRGARSLARRCSTRRSRSSRPAPSPSGARSSWRRARRRCSTSAATTRRSSSSSAPRRSCPPSRRGEARAIVLTALAGPAGRRRPTSRTPLAAAEQAVAAATASRCPAAQGRRAHDARDCRSPIATRAIAAVAELEAAVATRRDGRGPRADAPRPPEPV